MAVTIAKDGAWIIVSGGTYAETIEYLTDYGVTQDQVIGFVVESSKPTVLIKKG